MLETYARSLIEAAKAEDHVFRDLHELEVLAGASREVLAIVGAMFDRDQLDLLPRVAEMYRSMTEEEVDIVGVTVTTAIEIDDDLRAIITKKCEEDFGKRVYLIEKIDPSIIGGIVIEARGERRDISVRTQLRAARSILGGAKSKNGGDAEHA
ncbi:ATP synthase F1 subcomplex delta subunit [Coriobacterium glomerans PW2]|uniref:ATP synthase subunit delta n=1 Tax=Coriobacterium glomerans (strain ATCC 49209 / DSM 20642 / JCM 10262 / PW2) TaxID=700015 RepID=F2NAC8_CORGP|nr:ATP synthase F1 subcomplex delta subunit [Coriobacterium glomerans PW2]